LVKLAFVLSLYIYHGYCQRIYNQLQKNELKFGGFQLRLWNEVATIILIAVVFLVTLKNAINWIWGVVGIFLFSFLIMLMARVYKKIREKRSWDKEEAKVLNTLNQGENNHTE
jgi:putative membrane protein